MCVGEEGCWGCWRQGGSCEWGSERRENVRLVAYEALLSLVNHCRYLSSIHGTHESYCLL